MNIAFWDNQLCERGTSVSLFDYAYYNQTLLNNKSYIFYDKNNNYKTFYSDTKTTKHLRLGSRVDRFKCVRLEDRSEPKQKATQRRNKYDNEKYDGCNSTIRK